MVRLPSERRSTPYSSANSTNEMNERHSFTSSSWPEVPKSISRLRWHVDRRDISQFIAPGV